MRWTSDLRLASIAVVIVAVCAIDGAADTFPPSPIDARPHVTAARATTSIEIDGRLDEPGWGRAVETTPFVQYDPEQGAPSKFTTRVRILFDDEALYIGVRCDDPAGRDGTRVPDLRRDFDFDQNDLFGVSFDPFLTGRDAVSFQVKRGQNKSR
ncbi:MAG: hypothetical protein IAG13_20570 [Deltaproteobacteria bacterium]|nr:hypothetical protein [Nannocystaceae bacterium]